MSKPKWYAKPIYLLVALGLVLSLTLVTAAPVGAQDYEPRIGWWQSANPASGTAEYSTTQWHSADYSVHLEAFRAYSPNDYHEVYVANPTGVDSLADLDNVSFWYYCPSTSDEVAPLIDVWLDMDDSYSREYPPSGDDEWLLGMIADVITFDAWVEVTHENIQWVRATGGTVYGYGSAGLTAALVDLTDRPILAIGVETGGPGTYISSRDGDQEFYIDDLTINSTTYAMDPRIINTTKNMGYNTIQDAIDAASPSDTIIVGAGTYIEKINVNKANLNIRSEPMGGAVIDVSSLIEAYTSEPAVRISANGVTFDGFVVVGADLFNPGTSPIRWGIYLWSGVSDCTISNNTVRDISVKGWVGAGIVLYRADGNTIINNTCTSNQGDGIDLCGYELYGGDGCDNNIIRGNTCTNNGWNGIILNWNCSNNMVEDNTTTGNRMGITIARESNNNNFTNNMATGNSVAGIYVQDGAAFNIITGNTLINNCCGVLVWDEGGGDPHSNAIPFNHIAGNTGGCTWNGGGTGVETLVSGVHNSPTVAATVDATNNWWGDASGPSGVGPGSGDAVSDNVDFAPWLGAELEEVEFETINGSGTMQDTATGGDIAIDATGNHTITVATYSEVPASTSPFANAGSYYDVHLDDATNVTSLTIQFCPAHENEVICYWDGSSWVACSDQVYSDGCIVVTITDDTQPSLSDLAGLPFGKGFVVPVGGEAYPVSKASLFMPWIVLAVLLVGGVSWYVLKRRGLKAKM